MFTFYNKFEINLNASLAADINYLCEDILVKIGFDENYEPNEKGRILEELMDIIYKGFNFEDYSIKVYF